MWWQGIKPRQQKKERKKFSIYCDLLMRPEKSEARSIGWEKWVASPEGERGGGVSGLGGRHYGYEVRLLCLQL